MSKGGEPAYPVQDASEWQGHGLTKREAFAMAAMQALIGTAAAPALGGLDGFEPQTAKAACRMADALLAELAKEQNDEQ